MKIIVSGGRDFSDQVYMRDMLDMFYKAYVQDNIPELVCGMARGADIMAKAMFEAEGLKVHERPVDWKNMSEPCLSKTNSYGEYNALAGMKRNHTMGDEADILVVFWNGTSKGTKEMIDYMRKLEKPVYVFKY